MYNREVLNNEKSGLKANSPTKDNNAYFFNNSNNYNNKENLNYNNIFVDANINEIYANEFYDDKNNNPNALAVDVYIDNFDLEKPMEKEIMDIFEIYNNERGSTTNKKFGYMKRSSMTASDLKDDSKLRKSISQDEDNKNYIQIGDFEFNMESYLPTLENDFKSFTLHLFSKFAIFLR